MTLLKTWSKCTCQRICKYLRLLQFRRPSACCYSFTFFSFFNYLLTLNLCGQKIHPQICKHLGLLQVRGAKCTFSIYFLTMQALLFPLLSLSLSLLCLFLFSFFFLCGSSRLLHWFSSFSMVHQEFFISFLSCGSSGLLHWFSLL